MTFRGRTYKSQEIREDIELLSYWSTLLESSSPGGNTLVGPDLRSTVHSL
jgi:hypothetical protein